MNQKKKLLIIYEFFTPAYKGGGIIRSLANLAHFMASDMEIYVWTSNHDLDRSILEVIADQWTFLENTKIKIFYSSKVSRHQVNKIIKDIKPDTIYINGIFTIPFVIYPLSLKNRHKNTRWIICPRGMLQKGALKVKSLKKQIYLTAFKLFILESNLIWHATDSQEYEDIKRVIGSNTETVLAQDTPELISHSVHVIDKKKAELKLCFISLITEKKNLLQLIQILNKGHFDGKIQLDIYGPIKDHDYWDKCLISIKNMSSTINCSYLGALTPDQINSTIQKYHFFVLPSLGENFGHAIYEALNAGRPVIISDKTPWKNLSTSKAGWDISISSNKEWISTINQALNLEQNEFDQYCLGAQQVVKNYREMNDFKSQYLKLFIG